MASNLDLNVIISASFDKLKKGMADAVNVVKGSSKKMEAAAAGSQKALENALGGENLRVKRRELTQTINEQRSILTSFKQDLIALENKLAQTSKGDLMRQKALKNAIASLKVEIKDQESAVRNLSDARAETNFNLEEGSRRAEQNTQAMEAMSRAINAASMATLLLSGNNEKVGKVMRGVQVTMALASAAVAVYNLAQRQNEIYTTAAAAAQKVYAVAVGTSTGAMKAFRIALLATGIGAAIFALGFLVEKFASLGDEAEKATDKVSDFVKAIEDDELKALDLKHRRVMHQLKVEGAGADKLQAQEQSNYDEKLALITKLINKRKDEGKSAEDLYDLMSEITGAAAESEMSYQEEVAENGRKLREEELKNYAKYLEDKRKLEVQMQENLTKFLQDEEAKRLTNLSARRKPREMTEADMAPAAAAAAPAVSGLIGEGTQLFDDLGDSANTASDAVVNFANNFRAATRGLAMDMQANAIKAEQWRLSLENINIAVNNMLNSLKTEAIVGFAEMLGKAAVGELSAAQDFFQGFASALANFLDLFGKLLVAEGVAIQAGDIALKTGNGMAAIVAGGALVAAAAAMKAHQAKGIPAFADGGIVSGPTLGLMGEYPGARSNPEVIAPLDKLQSMINTGGGGNFVASTKFDGRDLWLAVNRYDKDRARG
jgi:hypothetical protein